LAPRYVNRSHVVLIEEYHCTNWFS